jgi:hypothetical protein
MPEFCDSDIAGGQIGRVSLAQADLTASIYIGRALAQVLVERVRLCNKKY